MSTVLRVILRLGRGVRTGWSLLGLTLVAALICEAGLLLMFSIKDTWIEKPFITWCDRIVNADAYRGADWPSEYCEEHHVTDMEWHSYVYWRRRPLESKHINIDEHGIRRTWNRPLASSDCGDDRIRIFVLGGSTIWGPATRDDYTVPSHLSRLLAEADVCVEVTNLGEQGYVSTQELILLLTRLQRGDVPDLVIFYDGVNELFSAHQNKEAGLPQNEANRRTEFNLLRHPEQLRGVYLEQAMTPEGIGRLRDAIQQQLSRAVESAKGSDPQPAFTRDELITETLAVYKSNVEMAQLLASHYGFEVLFYWQPMIFTKKNLSPYEQWWYETAAGEWKQFLLAAYQRVESDSFLNEEPRFRYIGKLFDEVESPYYVDAIHLTEDGNLLVAQAIAEDVVPLLQGPEQAIERRVP